MVLSVVFVATSKLTAFCLSFQADNLPDIPSQTVTEEKYTDEHGNMVVKKVSRLLRMKMHQDGFRCAFLTLLVLVPDHTEGDPQVCVT